ncbi:acetate--CoA ligase family protein [Candidatus Aciduliprofundum boonei]|uniref:acetate--CoA ligase (ADP-forming) n=1 Tax=Aciduliprofundum boonei (strain DSM 19572 / T469) TaxID=439481 RepID=B5IDQ5_ACIB4|nr:CoA-binding protein [Candidatus Aciduliprofundum boonei]ADD08130.1 CoA-binding domain protein [Aciduliprofundum boonei T469]EDY35598.1 CoA binding domain protein [Aciduliprofundum boonei T469]HII55886.1 CoA-binding protein [Candidatus Aciduliprofundum boonei]
MFDKLISPDSIAVVGASSHPNKIGYVVLENLKNNGYGGRIYPVNPKGGQILGFKVYPSINDVPEEVDLSVITLPAEVTVKIFEDVAKKSKFIIPIAGGFGETGKEGKERERKILEIAKKYNARIIGPNTVGIYIPSTGVNTALVVPERSRFPGDGDIAFITQSGALGLLTMDSVSMYDVGFSSFINLGNRVDVNENELLQYFGEDEKSKVIIMYIESFANGREFMRVAKNVSRKKPIVVLKAGRTKRGGKAASLHTGALGGSDAVADGAFKQCGVIRAYDEIELVDYARALAYGKPIEGDRIAVVTSAGGVGVVTTDYIESEVRGIGMKMAELSDEIKRRIRDEVVPFASVENPVDMTAQASDDDYDGVLAALNDDPNVDAILVYALFQTPLISEKLVNIITKWHREGDKPIVVGTIGSEFALRMMRKFEDNKVPVYPSIERSVKALRVLRYRAKLLEYLEGVE